MAAYRNPKPTVDVVIRLPDDRIVLIRRKNPPHGWAIPGGFVDEGEPLETAAVREAREETGLDVRLEEQFFTYGDPTRDPRHHTVATVYLARAAGEPLGGDDAAEARAFAPDALPPLVFDHGEILADVLRYLATGERRKLPAPRPASLPDEAALEPLLELARRTIAAGADAAPEAAAVVVPGLSPAGVVVTLYDAVGDERGSVGTSEPRPLATAIPELARRAAYDDPRFPPLDAGAERVEVEVCVLGPARRVAGPADVRPGLDAVRVRRGLHAALLLPSAVRDRSWSAETFLIYACRQAGLPGDAFRDSDTVVEALEARCRRGPLLRSAC